jgi:hypothetical protein
MVLLSLDSTPLLFGHLHKKQGNFHWGPIVSNLLHPCALETSLAAVVIPTDTHKSSYLLNWWQIPNHLSNPRLTLGQYGNEIVAGIHLFLYPKQLHSCRHLVIHLVPPVNNKSPFLFHFNEKIGPTCFSIVYLRIPIINSKNQSCSKF